MKSLKYIILSLNMLLTLTLLAQNKVCNVEICDSLINNTLVIRNAFIICNADSVGFNKTSIDSLLSYTFDTAKYQYVVYIYSFTAKDYLFQYIDGKMVDEKFRLITSELIKRKVKHLRVITSEVSCPNKDRCEYYYNLYSTSIFINEIVKG